MTPEQAIHLRNGLKRHHELNSLPEQVVMLLDAVGAVMDPPLPDWVRLDVRCACIKGPVLLRVLALPWGSGGRSLVVSRFHRKPLARQLDAKRAGTWPGGRNVPMVQEVTPGYTGPKDDLWWSVGWTLSAGWLDAPSAGRDGWGARCQCGVRASIPMDQLHRWLGPARRKVQVPPAMAWSGATP